MKKFNKRIYSLLFFMILNFHLIYGYTCGQNFSDDMNNIYDEYWSRIDSCLSGSGSPVGWATQGMCYNEVNRWYNFSINKTLDQYDRCRMSES